MEANQFLSSHQGFRAIDWLQPLDLTPTNDGNYQTLLELSSPVQLDRLELICNVSNSVADLKITVDGKVLSMLRASFGAESNVIIGTSSDNSLSTRKARGPLLARESLKIEYANSWAGANCQVRMLYTLLEEV